MPSAWPPAELGNYQITRQKDFDSFRRLVKNYMFTILYVFCYKILFNF